MKFKEKFIMDLIQNEKSSWDDTDLSWFDDDLLERFENKQLEKSEHQKIVQMLANDQTVMNHYKELKKQKNKGLIFLWFSFQQKSAWLFASLFVLVLSTFLLNQPITINEDDDLKRGTKTTLAYPINNTVYKNFPAFFVIPKSQELVRIELSFAKNIIWRSQWQKKQKIYLPLDIRDNFSAGAYKWKAITTNNKEVYSGHFTVEK